MVRQYDIDGENSGVRLSCEKRCTTLTGLRWKENLASVNESIVFVDENDRFIASEEFAISVRNSNNYFVIITRENLPNLPYSVEEIYGIHESGKYADLKKTYNELYRIYSDSDLIQRNKIDTVITEDSNSGYQFMRSIAEEKGIPCRSAGGKSKIYSELLKEKKSVTLVAADGAAFGSEMNRIMELIRLGMSIVLYLPESFEWLILRSGIVDGKRISAILDHPEDHIESAEYFSWERHFADILVSETKDSFLKYSKDKLNEIYLHDTERKAIMDAMDLVGEMLRKG